MTKYVLKADSFSGNITFFYDKAGYLVEFQMNSWDMETEQKQGMLMHLKHCLTDHQFVAWAQSRRYKFRKEKIDLSFERFYNMYGIKRDSFKAEPAWRRLSEMEQYNTLLNLKAYKAYCKRNPTYSQLYPAAYLNKARKDDWDTVPDFTQK